MWQREAQEQCTIELFVSDFGHLSFGAMVKTLVKFMKQYATAEYVFICDYFLPVASCHKREETTVVQLWHSCGLMKKIAHDTGQDIPENYKGDMFGNYSVLTLSAPVCVPVHARALKLPEARIHATGVSRTDYYFDREWNEKCRASFYEAYPQARGKKIALWAPTFRGNAAMAHLEGLDEIRRTAKELENEWYFILKAHPHVDAHGQVSNCTIPTEELLVVADVMITDYSSVMFDYLLYKKPIVLFAPDLAQYEAGRGFYLDYRKMPYPITQTGEALAEALAHCGEWMKQHEAEIDAFRELYVGSCDGHSTQRILELVMPQCTR
jgi:CDP-ribitol ribitolphosphotransferase